MTTQYCHPVDSIPHPVYTIVNYTHDHDGHVIRLVLGSRAVQERSLLWEGLNKVIVIGIGGCMLVGALQYGMDGLFLVRYMFRQLTPAMR